MISIYLGEENLPTNKKFIYDPAPLINVKAVPDTLFVRRVLAEVELGDYYNEQLFTTRFGGQLFYRDLSSGSKLLLLLSLYPDYVLNCAEMGDNALAYISLLDECNVFFPIFGRDVRWLRDVPVCLNGCLYDSYSKSVQSWG